MEKTKIFFLIAATVFALGCLNAVETDQRINNVDFTPPEDFDSAMLTLPTTDLTEHQSIEEAGRPRGTVNSATYSQNDSLESFTNIHIQVLNTDQTLENESFTESIVDQLANLSEGTEMFNYTVEEQNSQLTEFNNTQYLEVNQTYQMDATEEAQIAMEARDEQVEEDVEQIQESYTYTQKILIRQREDQLQLFQLTEPQDSSETRYNEFVEAVINS